MPCLSTISTRWIVGVVVWSRTERNQKAGYGSQGVNGISNKASIESMSALYIRMVVFYLPSPVVDHYTLLLASSVFVEII